MFHSKKSRCCSTSSLHVDRILRWCQEHLERKVVVVCYVQVLSGISKEHNSTLVVPIPKTILRHLGSKDPMEERRVEVDKGKTHVV